mmetsp:Transcript_18353/g.64458  ORF Transcript_18353/g.64458 Transcript_18353/m.64458 type:complete len:327 (-) Transcript_18353:779-1759(-)
MSPVARVLISPQALQPAEQIRQPGDDRQNNVVSHLGARVALERKSNHLLQWLRVRRRQVADRSRHILQRLRQTREDVPHDVVGKIHGVQWRRGRSGNGSQHRGLVPGSANPRRPDHSQKSQQHKENRVEDEVDRGPLVESLVGPNRRHHPPLVVDDVHAKDQNPYGGKKGCAGEEEFRGNAAAGVNVQDEHVINVDGVADPGDGPHAPQRQQHREANPKDRHRRQKIGGGEALRRGLGQREEHADAEEERCGAAQEEAQHELCVPSTIGSHACTLGAEPCRKTGNLCRGVQAFRLRAQQREPPQLLIQGLEARDLPQPRVRDQLRQ